MELTACEPGNGTIVVALGGEEALILLQPGEMFRRVLDGNPGWAGAVRFLVPAGTGGGVLAVLPRAAGPAWLEEVSTHPVEREFQELLWERANEASTGAGAAP
jgi:hypothetical protein